jgi:GAF domain-containing protein
MDNAILIVAGDAIDTSLGVTLGLSTMCAAAIGNIISDVAGILMGAAIEDWCATHLKLPVPQLTAAQRQLRSVRFANQWGTGVGMIVGCIIGMCPLLFIDSNKIQVLKREAHLDTMFKDVMTEASDLIGAQRACLYLIVNRPEESGWWFYPPSKQPHPKPTPDGKFLYAKYDASALPSTSAPPSSAAAVTSSTASTSSPSDRYIPLGRGIVSRAALTGEAWNIYSVQSEPEFVAGHDGGAIGSDNSSEAEAFRIDNMLCVPVLDSQGRAIAVIQAVNKVSKGTTAGREDGGGTASGAAAPFASTSTTSPLSSLPLLSPTHGFTNHDVQVLKALATHISVSLQRMYEDLGSGSEELRLRDTISMLKGSGGPQEGGVVVRHSHPSASSPPPSTSSSPSTTSSGSSSSHRTLLFPED